MADATAPPQIRMLAAISAGVVHRPQRWAPRREPTDGPNAGSASAVGEASVVEADDPARPPRWPRGVPATRYGGAVEIRPSEACW